MTELLPARLAGVNEEHCTPTMDIAEPSWLYTGRITEPDDQGRSRRFVYRTTLDLPITMYQRLLDLLDGATVIDSQILIDPDMMFGTGELSLWELAR
ncbi:hypothetical protein ACKUUI_05965 [Mycobacterium seoulense]|uniref:hypothetical protein n=1 Tax=Mycobacterium seoulense TaxID=386911 RepID=UPI003CF229D2